MLSIATCVTLLSTVGYAMAAGNNVISVNPPVAQADLTTEGSDWLWAAFAVMAVTALGVTVWASMIPAGQRTFHWIGVAILFTASIAYFSMAADLGATPIYVEFIRNKSYLYSSNQPYTRSIWYVRYIDWVVTTPLLLLELLLTTGMPLSGIFSTIFFDEVMIVGGLIGALVQSSYKWGYFTGATIALLYITWVLAVPARANAKALGPEFHKSYIVSASLLCFLWLLYPIAWGLCDGGNVISVDSEMIFYGILDLLAKPVFLIIHLLSLRKLPYEAFQLQSGHFSAYAAAPTGAVAGNNVANRPLTQEKRPLGAHTPAAGNAPVAAHGTAGTGTNAGVMHPVAAARPSDATAV